MVETLTLFVDWWTVAWTLLLLVGYLAELTPWPALRVLRSHGVARFMLFSSALAVFVLTLAEAQRAATVLTAWAIVFASLNWLFHYFRSLE